LALTDRRARRVYSGVLVVSQGLTVGTQVSTSDGYMLVWLIYHVIMYGVTTGLVLRRVGASAWVTSDTIFAALISYYLMGITWAVLYALLDQVVSSAFTVALVHGYAITDALYFSFVTLTTLGYGDIAPAHPLTRALATTEALIGQIFLAVFVARLVALHIVHTRERP
jgi:hypothetical protein